MNSGNHQLSSPARAPQPQGGCEESARIARLERMVESLARELGKKAEREG